MDDARGHRNLITLETLRIAIAIVFFMVRSHYWSQVSEIRERLEKLRTIKRMLHHSDKLRIRKLLIPLLQDLCRSTELANVMNKRGLPDHVDFFLTEPDRRCNRCGILGHLARMSVGVLVLLLDLSDPSIYSSQHARIQSWSSENVVAGRIGGRKDLLELSLCLRFVYLYGRTFDEFWRRLRR